MLVLKVVAPFAACRTMSAGWYRPTAPMLTPTAAYGLLLNIAAVEMRLAEEDPSHKGKVPSSITRPDLPTVQLAIGLPRNAVYPGVQSSYQQLHNYPVGRDAGMPEELAKGTKNNITPVRREFLSDLTAVVAVDGNAELEDRTRSGLRGEFNTNRYGLPFVGDNQCLIDRLEIFEEVPPTHWYLPIEEETGAAPHPRTVRLTTWICRTDMSQTKSALFAPTDDAIQQIPAEAFVCIPPASPTS